MMNVLNSCRQLTALVLLRFSRWRSEDGASLIEYALLVGLIAVVCIVAIQFLGNTTSSSLSGAGSQIGG